ncbi:MAG: bifunctional oligoribonuclease/PAP phosphatase NrnA [Ignavibacteria bacterium]|nr:bifunctional oligoribonuclease/PAP phosphatase NrnA [Ignavibacteria bacterium]
MNKDIVDLINNNQEFILTSHVNPDGDSIGSEIALFIYIKSLGKNARILNYSPTPDNYTFLDKDKVIEQFDETKHKDMILNADVIFILDTNEYERIRTLEPFIKLSSAKKTVIDHHLGFKPEEFDYYIIDTNSPATGEILYRFFKDIEINYSGKKIINPQIAEALYTAIMTDTGSFKYERTDAETHLIISELLKHGINPYDIYSKVYNNATAGKLHLLGRFLENVKLLYEGRLAYSTMLQKDFKETDTDEYAIEGFSTHLLSLSTVTLGIVFTETKNGVKLSFRSKGNVYSNLLAKEFGGGGHQNASGAFVAGGRINDLIEEAVKKAEKYLEEIKIN